MSYHNLLSHNAFIYFILKIFYDINDYNNVMNKYQLKFNAVKITSVKNIADAVNYNANIKNY